MKDTTALTVVQNDAAIMPVMDIQMAVMRRQAIVSFTKQLMVDGTDFGKIPGTGDKPTLLKPGAEKLLTLFGLTPTFTAVEVVEDWTGTGHGEPLFYYRYRCELYKGGNLIAGAEGSCNSWEAKYRWRKASRVCPSCGESAIIKGKEEFGGGWLCFKKNGGCGAKFKTGDERIEGQQTGRVPNPDVADLLNTIQKMSQKRALIAATLLAVNASEFFNQDLDDLVDAEYTVVDDAPQTSKAQRAPQPPLDDAPFMAGPEPGKPMITEAQKKELHALGTTFYNGKWDDERKRLVKHVTGNEKESSNELTETQAATLITGLQKSLRKRIQTTVNGTRIELHPILSEHGVNTLEDATPVGLTHIWKDIDARVKAAQPEPLPA